MQDCVSQHLLVSAAKELFCLVGTVLALCWFPIAPSAGLQPAQSQAALSRAPEYKVLGQQYSRCSARKLLLHEAEPLLRSIAEHQEAP